MSASSKSISFGALIACVFFTLGYGSRDWLASNDLADGIAEHVSKLETDKV